MENLRKHFITVEREFKEGTVEVFKQEIQVGHVKKCRLCITALGLYEAELNGQKIGDALFTPGFTYYPTNLHYQEYNITELQFGKNTLTVYLAQGWYCGRFTYQNKVQIYGENPAVSWILMVEDEVGSHLFCSDDSNVSAIVSPYEYAGLYDGEIYHADGWRQEVIQPVRYSGDVPEVIEKGSVYVRLREEMPVRHIMEKDGVTILDFGQNFAGIVVIDPAMMNGNLLKLRHGELLDKDGGLYTVNLRKAKAEIVYDKGHEGNSGKYCPRFTYMGFRYIEISGTGYKPGLITAYAVYSDMKRTGYFKSENVLVQKLYENQVWGQKSNYVEIPTDCPQRDERMGYTGDAQVFALTGAYNFDTEIFWAKFLKDIQYSQQADPEGYVTSTVPAMPNEKRGFMNMLGWGNCITIIPEMLYHQFGSDEQLRIQYDSMKAFVEMELRNMGGILGRRDLWGGPNLGDWLTAHRSVAYLIGHNGPVSNAFLVNDLRIMSWAAGYLGFHEDRKRYAMQYEKSRQAYIKAYVRKNGKMKDDYQGAYIMALKMVIPKGELWDKVFERLVHRIRKEGMQTGFFSTQHILPLLAENGQSKLAYDLLLQEDCPGWMYQVRNGATTTWERWDALKPDGSVNETSMGKDNMVSFNHYAFGSVGEFYYRYILGIRPLESGFSKVLIKPFMDKRLGAVSGSFQSRNGMIEVDWKAQNQDFILRVKSETDAKIVLPDGTEHELCGGGEQFFVC